MKAPSKEEWFKVYYFTMFLALWVAYALGGWAISEHLAVYLGVLVMFGLAAAGARMMAGRSESEVKDQDLKQRELRALAEELLEQARRGER